MKRWFLFVWVLVIFLPLLTGCGTAALANGGITSSDVTVQVTLTDRKIDSSLTRFLPDIPYHFVITNRSSKAHEFLLGPLIQPGMTMNDVEQQKLFGLRTIAPGATKSADTTFKNPAPQGVWQFSCRVGALYEPGMRLDVVVIDPASNEN